MSALPLLLLARHGETAWSLSGQHTGRTNLPLTSRGEQQARLLGSKLAGRYFTRVFSSPCRRAMRTCELAGYGAVAEVDADLVEWDYGDYEGRLSADIHGERPDWELFRDGCPGGETPEAVAERADRVVGRARAASGDVLVFSSGHLLRMLAARWLGAAALNGRHFVLGTTGCGALGYEHTLSDPVIVLWNDTSHLEK